METKEIIIAPKQPYEVVQTFTFRSLRWEILGIYRGHIHDDDFRQKLNRVRARLWFNNVFYMESPSGEYVKEIKRMNDLERYNRKMSKVFAEFVRQCDAQTGLFRDHEIKKISEKYIKTRIELKKRYGVE